MDLKFMGREMAVLLEGQREIGADVGALKVDITAIKAALVETATGDLMLRMLRSFEGQVEVAGIWTELLRETLEACIEATEARLGAVEAGR